MELQRERKRDSEQVSSIHTPIQAIRSGDNTAINAAGALSGCSTSTTPAQLPKPFRALKCKAAKRCPALEFG